MKARGSGEANDDDDDEGVDGALFLLSSPPAENAEIGLDIKSEVKKRNIQ